MMELIFLFIFCYCILIFPFFCFAKSVQITEYEVFRNVLISKESMYVNTRNALKKITQVEKTVTTIEHHLKLKLNKSKMAQFLTSASHGYSIISTGRVKLRIGDFSLYLNYKRKRYRLKYTFRF